jgi:5-(carboxyamino)imidazole ribonucleotide synthase
MTKTMGMVLPPQTIGIMGGGQLGRMLAISARQMGYKVIILEPKADCPAKDFANKHIIANYDDKNALDLLGLEADIITTEFENVPAQSMKYLSQFKPVYPRHNALLISQNRLKEKQFFNQVGIYTTEYYEIRYTTDIDLVNVSIYPAILKTTTLGYDGKGQIPVNNKEDLIAAFNTLRQTECILEKKLKISKEVSVIVARNMKESCTYDIVENTHKNGILDISIAPARINENLKNELQDWAIAIVNQLDYIGVLAIEFFITPENKIIANEMAPRPHNSGHHTIDACITSQFEQQIRSICNLKLGNSALHSQAIMLNLLSDIYKSPSNMLYPAWDKVLAKYDNVKLHLYDKHLSTALLGRKMGHLTFIGKDIDILLKQAEEVKLSFYK